jgi:transcriptional regulator with XRE-family HTH domain
MKNDKNVSLDRLKVLLKEIGFSQVDLVKETSFSLSYISAVLNGAKKPSPKFLKILIPIIENKINKPLDDLYSIIDEYGWEDVL